MNLHDLPLHTRPREKLQAKGIEALSKAEVLALLIRTGYHGKNAIEVAQRILKNFSFNDLSKLSLGELSQLKGIGPTRAAQLLAAFELGKIALQQDHRQPLVTPKDIYPLLQPWYHKKQEHLVCLYLNARNQLIAQEVLSIGTISSAMIHPREIFAPAIEHRASHVILAHNHPSGDTYPSEDDIIVTQKVVEAGYILDIPIFDHLIVSEAGWTSLKLEQLM